MRKVQIAALMAACAIGTAVLGASCSSTPVNVPLSTFQQAQKADVVCIAVNDSNGNPLRADRIAPTVPGNCALVPANTNASALANHLFAVVTQTTRGELAVVDLTAGNVVDEDRSTPGINFIPVGVSPTDVAVTPDGKLTIVSSAAPAQPALYAIDNTRLLGDYAGVPPPGPLRLTDLRVCTLPQPPQALAIVTPSATDGGPSASQIVVLLRAFADLPAQIVTIPTSSFLPGGGDGGDDGGPGTLSPCTVLGAAGLSAALPSSWTGGPAWPDGVVFADAGDLSEAEPPPGPGCGAENAGAGTLDAAGLDAPSEDAGTDSGGAGDAGDSSAGDAGMAADAGNAGPGDGGLPISAGPFDMAHPTSMVLRDDVPLLYVGDDAVPVIHVIDVSNPSSPRELAPLLATSVLQPSRRVTVGGLAISPPTRDYTRYLYAIDTGDGSLMVYDVTDPAASPHVPLERPHPELNPFFPPDRLTFSAPVATIAFAQHDWPVVPPNLPDGGVNSDLVRAYSGRLCNPNHNAHPDAGTYSDVGFYYRADQTNVIQALSTVQSFPYRLRGVFAFATLSNGNMVTVDVDDWDAPCRRPEPMEVSDGGGPGFGMTGVLDLPEPVASSSSDLDPYHAPVTYSGTIAESPAVTQEAFYPVSAPNRTRSNFLLRNDPSSGFHMPNVIGTPQLVDMNGAPVATAGAGGLSEPLLLPTALAPGFIDPSEIQNPTEPDPSKQKKVSVAVVPAPKNPPAPGVRLSFDDPTATFDQDWAVTYEGVLPQTPGLVADILSQQVLPDGGPPPAQALAYDRLVFSAKGESLCEHGVEDWTIGKGRAARALAEMQARGLPQPTDLPQWTGDYVEITDDLLASTDPYWTGRNIPDSGPDCWEPSLNNANASDRYNACQQTFGAPGSNPDLFLARDLPIVNAYEEALVVGRFAWQPKDAKGHPVPERTTNRVIVGPDPSNVPFLKLVTCCFHSQAAFKVRAGGEWVATGNGVGLLHHVVACPSPDPTLGPACVLSGEQRSVLTNARSFDVPWCNAPMGTVNMSIDRNSPLAMRNPMLSYVMWSGCGTPPGFGDHTLTARDLTWKFSVHGGFVPLSVSLTGNTTAGISPQSMLFIRPLGQMAIVDGSQQGLITIDLNTLGFAHAPYF